MSFIRTIRKNVAAYRARKSAEHYSRQAFGIEQLEPRLLLTADISAVNAEIIMNDLSQYSISALDNITAADVITAEYKANNYSSVENLLDSISDVDNGILEIDLSSSLLTNSVNISGIGGFSFTDSSKNAAASVKFGGTIEFNYSDGDLGSFSNASLTVNNVSISGAANKDFGFLNLNDNFSLPSNLSITTTILSDGSISYSSPNTISLAAVIKDLDGVEQSYSDTVTLNTATGIFTGTTLSGFQNINADSVAGQIKSFKEWLDSLTTSSLFTGSSFDTGILDSDTISTILNFSEAFSEQYLYDTTNSTAKIFSNSDLTEVNITDADSLASILGGNAAYDFDNNRLSYTFTVSISGIDESVLADFHASYEGFASITTTGSFDVTGSATLSVTLGFDLSNNTTLSTSTDTASLVEAATYTSVADSAIASNYILTSDAAFVITMDDVDYLVTIPQADSRSFTSLSSIAAYLNSTGLDNARLKSDINSDAVKLKTDYSFSASVSEETTSDNETIYKLTISSSEDFILNTPEWIDCGTYTIGNNKLGLSGTVDSSTNQYEAYMDFTSGYDLTNDDDIASSVFYIKSGNSTYTITLPVADTEGNTTISELASDITTALKTANKSGTTIDLTSSTYGLSVEAYDSNTLVFRSSSSAMKAFSCYAESSNNLLGFSTTAITSSNPGYSISIDCATGVLSVTDGTIVLSSESKFVIIVGTDRYLVDLPATTYDVTTFGEKLTEARMIGNCGKTLGDENLDYGFTCEIVSDTVFRIYSTKTVFSISTELKNAAVASLGFTASSTNTDEAKSFVAEDGITSTAGRLSEDVSLGINISGTSYTITVSAEDSAMNNSIDDLVDQINAVLSKNTHFKNKVVASCIGNRIVFSTTNDSEASTLVISDASGLGFTSTTTGYDTDNVTSITAINDISSTGILANDAYFIITVTDNDATTITDYSITIKQSVTTGNDSIDDLVGEIQAAIDSYGDDLAGFTVVNNDGIISIEYTGSANKTFSITVDAINAAVGSLGIKNTSSTTNSKHSQIDSILPSNGILSEDLQLQFSYQIDTNTRRTYTVSVSALSTKSNTSSADLVDQINTAIKTVVSNKIDITDTSEPTYNMLEDFAGAGFASPYIWSDTSGNMHISMPNTNSVTVSCTLGTTEHTITTSGYSYCATSTLPATGKLTSDAVFEIGIGSSTYTIYIDKYDTTKNPNDTSDTTEFSSREELVDLIRTKINAALNSSSLITVSVSGEGNLVFTSSVAFTLTAYTSNSASTELGLTTTKGTTSECDSVGYRVTAENALPETGGIDYSSYSSAVTFFTITVNVNGTNKVFDINLIGNYGTNYDSLIDDINTKLRSVTDSSGNKLSDIDSFSATLVNNKIRISSSDTEFTISSTANTSGFDTTSASSSQYVYSVSGTSLATGKLSADAKLKFSFWMKSETEGGSATFITSVKITILASESLSNTSAADLAAQLQEEIDKDTYLSGKILVEVIGGTKLAFRYMTGNSLLYFIVSNGWESTEANYSTYRDNYDKGYYQLGFGDSETVNGSDRESSTDDIIIYCNNGNAYKVDLSACTTIESLLTKLNAAGGGQKISASIGSSNNIIIRDLTSSTYSVGAFRIEAINGSTLGAKFGLTGSDGLRSNGVLVESADGKIIGSSISVGSVSIKEMSERLLISQLELSGSLTISTSSTNGLTATASMGSVSIGLTFNTDNPDTTEEEKLSGTLGMTLRVASESPLTLNEISILFAKIINGDDTLKSQLFTSIPKLTIDDCSLYASVTVSGLPSTICSDGNIGTAAIIFNGNYSDGSINYSSELNLTADLSSLKNINLDTIVSSIIDYLPTIISKLSGDAFDAKLPLINKSLNDLSEIKDEILTAVERLRTSDVVTLQQLEDIMESALGLSSGGIELSIDSVTEGSETYSVLKISLTYDTTFTQNLMLDSGATFEIDGTKFSLAGAAYNIEASCHFIATLDFGIAIGSTAKIFLYEDTNVNATLTIDAKDLDFNLGMGSVGLFVKDGWLNIEGTFFAKFKANSDDDSDDYLDITSVSISDNITSGISNSDSCYINGELPVYFPTDSNKAGNIYIDGWDGSARTGTANLQDILNTPAVIFNTSSDDGNSVTPHSENYEDSSSTSYLQTKTSTSKILIDLSEIVSYVEGKIGEVSNWSNLNLFDKINLVLDGTDLLLAGIQDKVNVNLESLELPVVGTAFSSGANFIEKIRTNLIDTLQEKISAAGNLEGAEGAKKIAQMLYNALSGLGILEAYAGTIANPGDGTTAMLLNSTGTSDIQYSYYFADGEDQSGDFAQWNFTIGGDYTVGSDVAFDLGVPGISLDTDGTVSVTLHWSMSIGIGISASEGFYIALCDDNGQEMKLDITAEVDGTMTGSLGFLEVLADTSTGSHTVELSGSLGLNVSGNTLGDNIGNIEGLSLSTISSLDIDPVIKLGADVNLGLTLGILSDTTNKQFPNIYADFVFEWGWSSTSSDIADGVSVAGFENITLDMGQYMSNVIKPFLSSIQEYTKPVQSIINFLTTPLPVLDDLGYSITPLELAEMTMGDDIDTGMIYAVSDIISLINSFSTTDIGAFTISFGNFYFINNPTTHSSGSGSGLDLSDVNFLKQSATSDSISGIQSKYKNQTDAIANNISSQISGSSSGAASLYKEISSEEESSWSFPIISDPMQIFGLLMGKNATLVTYDMPSLTIDFQWDQYFPICGPLGVSLSLNLGAKIDFAFGYDTLGISEFIDNDFQDTSLLLDGFYIDHDPKNPELTLYGGLTASVELNAGVAKAGVGGGIGIQVDFSLNDPDKDNKVRFGELESNFMYEWNHGSQVLASLAIFDVSGEIWAQLYAYLKIGWGWFSWSHTWNITPKITIASYDVDFARDSTTTPVVPVLATEQENGDLLINAGPNAADRMYVDTADGDEIFEVNVAQATGSSGYDVTVKYQTYSQKYQVKSGATIYFKGGEGNDSLKVTSANGVTPNLNFNIEGGNGDDKEFTDNNGIVHYGLDFSGYSGSGKIVVSGGAGDDTIKGSAHKENASDAGENDLFGNAGDDIIKIYGSGNNFVFGDDGEVNPASAVGFVKTLDDGDDEITDLGTGKAYMFGGGGKDTINGNSAVEYLIGDGGTIKFENEAKTAVFTDDFANGVEGASGDEGDADKIYGNGGHISDDDNTGDVIYGGGGNDTISALSGSDYIDAGGGNDTVRAGDGNNKIYGCSGDDVIFCGDGDDVIYGGDGNDTVYGDSNAYSGGKDTIYGGKGSDQLFGLAGDDNIYGGDQEDYIVGGYGNDYLDGGLGSDIILGDNSFNYTSTSSSSDEINEKVFGSNIYGGYLFKNSQSSAWTSLAGTGDDTLISDGGSDFLDGQGGYDTYNVKLRNESTSSYINVADSGLDSVSSTDNGGYLSVTGTSEEDTFLLRVSSTGLGMIALVKDPTIDGGTANVDRINYWGRSRDVEDGTPKIGIDNMQIDSGLGDDSFNIDDVGVATVLRGDVGNDTFQVGQLYNSPRNKNAGLADEDAFDTEETSMGTYLSAGITGTMSIYGGDGNDTFTVLRNQAVLSLFGDNGNDDFTIKAFLLKDGSTKASTADTVIKSGGGKNTIEYAINAPVNIIGGSGYDSVSVIGTEGADTFIVTEDGVYGAGLFASFSGIESLTIDAAEGDDRVYVLSTSEDFDTVIEGGAGSDTFSVGGTGVYEVVPADDYKGYSGIISNTLTSNDTEYATAIIDGVSANIVNASTSSTDTTAPEVVVEQIKDGVTMRDNTIDLSEGGTASFIVRLTRVPGYAVTITLTPPAVSDEDKLRGISGLALSASGYTTNPDGSLTIKLGTYTVNGNTVTVEQITVTVTAVADDASKAKGGLTGVITGSLTQYIALEMETGDSSISRHTLNPVKVTTHDSQSPEIIVSKADNLDDDALNLWEGVTETKVLNVHLSKAPTTSVTVHIASEDSRLNFRDKDGNVITSLTFNNNSNSDYYYAKDQKVYVYVSDDSKVTGVTYNNIEFTIASTSAESDTYGSIGESFNYKDSPECFVSLFYTPVENSLLNSSGTYVDNGPTVIFTAYDASTQKSSTPITVSKAQFSDGLYKAVSDNLGWYADGNKIVFVDKFGNKSKVRGTVDVSYKFLNPGYYNEISQTENFYYSAGKSGNYVKLQRDPDDHDSSAEISVTFYNGTAAGVTVLRASDVNGIYSYTKETGEALDFRWYLTGDRIVFVDTAGNEVNPVSGTDNTAGYRINVSYKGYGAVVLSKVQVAVSDNDAAQIQIIETNGSTDLVEMGATFNSANLDSYIVRLTKPLTGDEEVYITIDGSSLVGQLDSEGNQITEDNLLFSLTGAPDEFYSSITLKFTDDVSELIVYVEALDANTIESTKYQAFAAQQRTVDRILGTVYINGAGGNGSVSDQAATVLPYETSYLAGTAVIDTATTKKVTLDGEVLVGQEYQSSTGFSYDAFSSKFNYGMTNPGCLLAWEGDFSSSNLGNIYAISSISNASNDSNINLVISDSANSLAAGEYNFALTSEKLTNADSESTSDTFTINVNNFYRAGLTLADLYDRPIMLVSTGAGGNQITGKQLYNIISYTLSGSAITLTIDKEIDFSAADYYAIVMDFPISADSSSVSTVTDLASETDRLYINDQDSMFDNTSDTRKGVLSDFTASDDDPSVGNNAKSVTGLGMATSKISQTSGAGRNGVFFGNMEQLEVNTGAGNDTFDVNATLFDNTAYTTDATAKASLTVINTGYGNDTVNVGTLTSNNTENAALSDGPLSINTQDGEDTIQFNTGATSDVNMYLFGGRGMDTINAGTGKNVVFGDEGLVTFADGVTLGNGYGKPSDPKIQTGNRNVTIAVSTNKAEPVEGNVDTIILSGGNNIVIGGGGGDTITALGGNNDVIGDNGELDYTNGLLTTAKSTDPAIGGADTINLSSGANTVIGGIGGDSITVSGGYTGGGNTIIGDDGQLDFTSSGYLKTAQTTDPMYGDADTITLAAGNNTVLGGAGGDTIDAGLNQAGTNIIMGDNGIIQVHESTHVITSVQTLDPDKGGNDIISTGTGDSIVVGGVGTDYINVNPTTRANRGSPNGRDMVIGDSGIITWDSNGNGQLQKISSMTDTYGGDDWIYTGIGDDIVIGGAGGDHIDAGSGAGSDIVIGDNGYANFTSPGASAHYVNYITSADPNIGGADIITTGTGNDVIIGGALGDTINAGIGASGNNVIFGDDGEAYFDTAQNMSLITSAKTSDNTTGGVDHITTGNGRNVVVGGPYGDFITTGSGDDAIVGDSFGFSWGWPNAINFNVFTGISLVQFLTSEGDAAQSGITYDDTIQAGAGNNAVIGGLGNDYITSGSGNDAVMGDNGHIDFNNYSATQHIVQKLMTTNAGTGGNDTITTGAGDDEVIGGDGNDTLTVGVDNLSSGTDNDVALGDNGYMEWANTSTTHIMIHVLSSDNAVGGNDDIFTGDGDDITIAGTGSDTVNSDRSGNATGSDYGNDIVIGDIGIVVYQTLNNIGYIQQIFNNGDSTNGAADYIATGYGNDIVIGGLGGDTIKATPSASDAGKDMVIGDDGFIEFDNTTISGTHLIRKLYTQDDTVGGDDNIFTGNGDSVVLAGVGNDYVNSNRSTIAEAGTQNGADVMIADNGMVEYKTTGTVNFVWKVTGYNTTQGNDVMFAGTGQDIMIGGPGADYLDAAGAGTDSSRDMVLGDCGYVYQDLLNGTPVMTDINTNYVTVGGNDDIFTGDGNDVVVAGIGDDCVNFNRTTNTAVLGNDTGADVVIGDNGWVQYLINSNSSMLHTAETYDPSNGGNDIIFTGSGEDIVLGGSGNDIIDTVGSQTETKRDTIIGDNGRVQYYNSITGTNAGVLAIIDAYSKDNGNGGNDDIFSGAGSDIVIGGSGSDFINQRRSSASVVPVADVCTTDAGNDVFMGDNGHIWFSSSTETVPLSSWVYKAESIDNTMGGDDAIFDGTGAGNDTVIGGIGNDYINADKAGLVSGVGNALITNAETGTDNYVGDNGTIIFTGTSAMIVSSIACTDASGSTNNDVIYSGGGIDLVMGGTGADYINSGNDSVKDILAGDNGTLTVNSSRVQTGWTASGATAANDLYVTGPDSAADVIEQSPGANKVLKIPSGVTTSVDYGTSASPDALFTSLSSKLTWLRTTTYSSGSDAIYNVKN